jgi:prevent-host-death family protein
MLARRTVGARELKTRLGRYLRRVRQGETLVVTDRGQPAAELRPIAHATNEVSARLARLMALGLVTQREARPLRPFRPATHRGKPVSEAIVDDREDRF